MIDVTAILLEIEVGWTTGGCMPSEEDFGRWAGSSPETQSLLFDQIGAEIARGYHEGSLSFEFCDTLVNHLFGLLTFKQTNENPVPWPPLFWRVYEAFDAGEWALPSRPEFDPVSTFTDPDVAEIVDELDSRTR